MTCEIAASVAEVRKGQWSNPCPSGAKSRGSRRCLTHSISMPMLTRSRSSPGAKDGERPTGSKSSQRRPAPTKAIS